MPEGEIGEWIAIKRIGLHEGVVHLIGEDDAVAGFERRGKGIIANNIARHTGAAGQPISVF